MKLTVNVNKTKVLVFSKRKCQQNFDCTLNGERLDVIDSYTYLGITFKYNGSFVDARKRLVEHTLWGFENIMEKSTSRIL
jgi:hypothetical protein